MVSGVYYTDNFVGPGTQPTWTAVNTGLAATDCREFFLDPFHQAERQYVMLEASRSLYRREDGGAWSVIFDYDTAHTVLGSTPLYGETLYGFCVDPQTDGRLWVSYKYVYDPVGTYDYVFTSDDYGDSWSAILFYTGNSYDIQSPRCNGDSIFVPHVSGAGGAYHIQYTANAGANWSISTQAAFGWKTSIAVNPLTGIAYIEQDVLATHDLAYLEDDGTTGTLQADITLSRNDAMWFDPTDADHQRLVHNSRLYVTTDSWANRNAPSAISYGVISIAPWAGNDTDQMLVGLTINHGVGQDHAVAALYGEDDTSSQGIAGSSPGTPPYTDSIPYGCGGVCSMGVQAVEGTGVVHTYSVAMPGYTGTERGEPVPGDRASWETGVTHADDIQDVSFDYHNNPADPPMLVSDYDSDADGIVDAAETAPWAGITDKPTEFTPEDHDHSGDAGDGGAFDAANLTSGASTDGQVLTSDGAGGAAWEDQAGGASAFTDLTDTPADYTDDGGKYVRVNSGETALEFVDLPETAYAETIGDGIDDTFDIVHNLDSTDVIVQVWDLDATPVTLFEPDSIHVIDADTVRVVFASAPDTDQMRVVVVIGGGGGAGGAPAPVSVNPLVQSKNSGPNNSDSYSVTLNDAPTVGNFLIAFVVNEAANTVSSITQTNVSWSLIVRATGANGCSEIWLGIISANPGTGVAVSMSGSAWGAVAVAEFDAPNLTPTADQTLTSSWTYSANTSSYNHTALLEPSEGTLVVGVLGHSAYASNAGPITTCTPGLRCLPEAWTSWDCVPAVYGFPETDTAGFTEQRTAAWGGTGTGCIASIK